MTIRDSLAQVVALLDRATPGDWEVYEYNYVVANGVEVVRDSCNFGSAQNMANIESIVWSVNFLREHGPELMKRLEGKDGR